MGVAVAVGCGPTVADSGGDGSDGDSAAETGASTQTSTSTSGEAGTGVGSTSAVETSTTTPQESITDPYMPTVSGSTGSSGSGFEVSSSAGDTSGSTTGAACEDAGVYRAVQIIGALNRVRIYRRDDDAMRCDWMSIASPMEGSQYDVPVTRSWGLEQAFWNSDPSSCDDDDPSPGGASSVPDISGTIDIEFDSMAWPCTLDLDLTLQLISDPDPPWFVELCQQRIQVEGCEP